jgi:hypothetical protein
MHTAMFQGRASQAGAQVKQAVGKAAMLQSCKDQAWLQRTLCVLHFSQSAAGPPPSKNRQPSSDPEAWASAGSQAVG